MEERNKDPTDGANTLCCFLVKRGYLKSFPLKQMFGWRHSECLDELQPAWPQMETAAEC